MKKDTDQLLEELAGILRPERSLDQVERWVRRGRAQPRFHLTVWLSRLWRRPLN